MSNIAENSKAAAEKPSGSRKLELYQMTLIGLVLGIMFGVFLGELAGVFKPVGDVFIRLLQITVIPYISLSLITGIGSLGIDTIRRLSLYGGLVLLGLWLIAIVLVLLAPLAFPDWPSASFFSTSLITEAAPPDYLLLFIPSNPFYSYANAIVPAVVVFSILVGVALIQVKEKHVFIEPLNALLKALAKVLGIITRLTPLGVFALMANTIGTIAIEDLMRLQVFIVVYGSFALILSLWILPGLIATISPLRFTDISQAMRTPVITAFATGSGLLVVPMIIEKIKKLLEETKIIDHGRREYADSLVEILIPTVYPFPSAGVVLSISFVLFAGWYIGFSVPVDLYPALISMGIPSLFVGTLVSMPTLLDIVELPSDLYEVFISIDVIIARFSTLVGAMSYAFVGLIGTLAMLGQLHFRWLSLIKFTVISTVLIVAVISSIQLFYTHVVVVPYTKDEALRSLRLLQVPQPATLIPEVQPEHFGTDSKPAGFSEIAKRGVLRVCYQPNEYPSAFYNNETPPQLVGFDIEMAHRFADKQNLALEFIPASDEGRAASMLNTGVCDIYMRSMPIAANRAKMFGLTAPIYKTSVGLVVKDYRREEFRRWETLNLKSDALRVGVENSTEALSMTTDLLPGATFIPMNIVEQEAALASGAAEVDAIIDMAEEAAAWTLLYPAYSVVVPQPTISLPVAYAVARGNSDLLAVVNAWLVAEEARGTIRAYYGHWMLGGAMKIDQPIRWSVIRDVLGWVD